MGDLFTCRICLEEYEKDEKDLISPCKCRGSRSRVHRSCLEKWRGMGGGEAAHRCEVCHHPYEIYVQSSYPPDEQQKDHETNIIYAIVEVIFFLFIIVLFLVLSSVLLSNYTITPYDACRQGIPIFLTVYFVVVVIFLFYLCHRNNIDNNFLFVFAVLFILFPHIRPVYGLIVIGVVAYLYIHEKANESRVNINMCTVTTEEVRDYKGSPLI